MTFEEFFKKKKINLELLQQAEPALFSEFEAHYGQMGEKSFDHTKKYWFNQLRRKFPAPPEVKVEKVIIENQLAEQTIADTLTEPAAALPSVGFKPRFKAGMVNKPAEEKQDLAPEQSTAEEKPAADSTPAPALGFKPKFRTAAPPKPATEHTATEAETPAEATKPAPALGFKPKFKATTPPKPAAETETPVASEEKTDEPAIEAPAETAPKPMGFKPRFSAENIKPKE